MNVRENFAGKFEVYVKGLPEHLDSGDLYDNPVLCRLILAADELRNRVGSGTFDWLQRGSWRK